MMLNEKGRKTLLGVTTFACGILGFALFRWTPTSSLGILAYVALFAVLIVLAVALSPKRTGYWPSKPEDR